MLKYRISELIARLPSKERQKIRSEIREVFDVKETMCSRKIYATINEETDIKGYQLLKISEILKCKTVDELYNKETVCK